MNNKKRIIILRRLQTNNPYPKFELNFSSNFELLIAAMLSTRTRDVIVNQVTNKLYLIANNPQKMLKLGTKKIKHYIRPIGFFNKKTKNIINICQILINKYNSKIPENRSELESLPGVGRKVTNIILNVAFGLPTIAVDTHIFRFCNRSNLASGKTSRIVENKLLKLIPKKIKTNCHSLLLSHAKYVCKANNPNCKSCIIQDLCEFKEKHI